MIRRIVLLALLLLFPFVGQAADVNSYPVPWGQIGNTVSLSVTSTTGNVQLGWAAVSPMPSPPPSTAYACNTGANAAYVLLGTSSVAVTTSTGTYIAAGVCMPIAIGPTTNQYLAGITSSSTTTLVIMSGTGSPVAGGVPGGGGGALTPIANGTVLGNSSGATAFPSALTTLPSGLTIPSPTFTGTVAGAGTVPNVVLANSGLTLGSTALTLGVTTTSVAGLTLTTPTFTGLVSVNGWVPAWNARFDSANSASTGTQAGYVTGDTITLATTGGTCTTAPVIAVNIAAAGSISKWFVQNPGACSVIPTQPQTQASTTGSGTGATFTLTYQPLSYQTFDNLAAAGNFRIGGSGAESAGAALTTSSESTLVGDLAGVLITTGGNNTCVGHHCLGTETTGSSNTAVGTDALRNPNGVSGNAAFGVSSMKEWQASFSTAFGTQSLQGKATAGSSGASNVAVGYQALLGAAATTAARNVAMGANAMNSGSLTTASDNTVVGENVGQALTTGGQNSVYGAAAAATLATGGGAVIIGYKADVTGAGNNDTIAIGGSSAGGGSGMRIGNASVGIGGKGGNASLTGGTNILIGYSIGNTNCTTGSNVIEIFTNAGDCSAAGASNEIQIGTGSTATWKATGTNTPSTSVTTIAGLATITGAATLSSTLTVSGMTNVATTSAVCYNTSTGLVTYDGTIGTCTISAERFKIRGEPLIGSASARLAQLRTEAWTYKQESREVGTLDDRVHVGLYADDVAKLDERCVGYRDGNVQNYEDRCVLAYLVAANKEHQREIQSLKDRR